MIHTFKIEVIDDHTSRTLTAAVVADALACCIPYVNFRVQDFSNHAYRNPNIAERMSLDAPPPLLKALCHYLDDKLQDMIRGCGACDETYKATEAREYTGIWNNGKACRYDTINPELILWEQAKLNA